MINAIENITEMPVVHVIAFMGVVYSLLKIIYKLTQIIDEVLIKLKSSIKIFLTICGLFKKKCLHVWFF